MYSAIQTGQQFGMQTLDQNLSGAAGEGCRVQAKQAALKAANKDSI